MERLDQLVHRVRWLDRYRRPLAIALGLAASIGLYVGVSSEWPQAPAAGVLFATTWLAWWLGEIVLAGLAALWETEANELSRTKNLPRAIVRAK